MFKLLVLSAVLSGGYFLVVTLFFRGPLAANLLDNIPDLFTLTLGLAFFLLSSRIAGKTRFVLRLGAVLIVIGKQAEVILQEYLFIQGAVPPPYWLFLSLNNFLGLLLLLFSLKTIYDK